MNRICLALAHLICPAVLLLAGEQVHGTSFDCTKATTQQERAICASPELSAADDRMAAAYKAVLAATPSEMKDEVRNNQRAWIRGMALACTRQGSGKDLSACLEDSEMARLQALHHMTLRLGSVTFVWRSINLEARDDPDVSPDMHQQEANPGFGTLKAEWPQAGDPSLVWKAWNRAIDVAARELTNAARGVPSGKMPAKWAASGGVDENITTSIGIVDEDLVTAAIENDWDGHGAHPNINSTQFNWLLKEKRELKPEDVFRPKSTWDLFLQKQCDQYLHQQLDAELGRSYDSVQVPGDMAKTLHGIVIEPENWQLDSKGLTIIFQDYAVACHACRPPPVTIPWQDLEPFLQTGFVIPKPAAATGKASSE